MLHFDQKAQRNVGQPQTEASAMLLQLLHQQVGGAFVVTTKQVAGILGKSEAGLRLAESRHRAKYGYDLLPKPLLQNAAGRGWSIAQIAQWLSQGGLSRPDEALTPTPTEKPAKRLGRPRKSIQTETGGVQ